MLCVCAPVGGLVHSTPNSDESMVFEMGQLVLGGSAV